VTRDVAKGRKPICKGYDIIRNASVVNHHRSKKFDGRGRGDGEHFRRAQRHNSVEFVYPTSERTIVEGMKSRPIVYESGFDCDVDR
jgi:hypothetical protein